MSWSRQGRLGGWTVELRTLLPSMAADLVHEDFLLAREGAKIAKKQAARLAELKESDPELAVSATQEEVTEIHFSAIQNQRRNMAIRDGALIARLLIGWTSKEGEVGALTSDPESFGGTDGYHVGVLAELSDAGMVPGEIAGLAKACRGLLHECQSVEPVDFEQIAELLDFGSGTEAKQTSCESLSAASTSEDPAALKVSTPTNSRTGLPY